jgi:hypothetical protein
MFGLFEWPHWQKLAFIFKPPFPRLLVPWFAILPIVLQVMQDVPERVTFGQDALLILHFTLPFKWWLLWWGSFFYAIAFAIYSIRCPAFIKSYPSYAVYLESHHSPRWVVSELRDAVLLLPSADSAGLFERLVTKKLATAAASDDETPAGEWRVEQDGTSYWFVFKEARYKITALDGVDGSKGSISNFEREVFWEVYEPLAKMRLFARASTAMFALLAAGAFIVVVLQNICTVIKALTT